MKLPDVNNANLINRIHFWLIKKVVGKKVVILNASITVKNRKPEHGKNIAIMENINNGILSFCSFEYQHDLVYVFGQADHS